MSPVTFNPVGGKEFSQTDSTNFYNIMIPTVVEILRVNDTTARRKGRMVVRNNDTTTRRNRVFISDNLVLTMAFTGLYKIKYYNGVTIRVRQPEEPGQPRRALDAVVVHVWSDTPLMLLRLIHKPTQPVIMLNLQKLHLNVVLKFNA